MMGRQDVHSPASKPSVVIVIYIEADGTRYVRSVEVMCLAYVTRFFFSQNNLLKEVLTEDATRAIGGILDGVNSGRALISMPDEKIQLQNLCLQGCDIFVGSGRDGGERLMLRFQSAFGNVLSLFRRNITVIGSAVEEPGSLAVETMEAAMLPLFNLAYHIESILDADGVPDEANVRRVLETLVDRIRETESGFGIHKRRFLPENGENRSRRPSSAIPEFLTGQL